MDSALSGGFENASTQSADVFRTALNVLSRPGKIEKARGANAPSLSEAAASLILMLCDPETPIYITPDLDTPDLRGWIAFHTGAPIVERQHAHFALGKWVNLQPLDAFRTGTAEYPDRSVTLIVETESLKASPNAILKGPGIKDQIEVWLPDIEPFQRNAAQFPNGADFFFTSGDQVMGLPRTSTIEVL